MLGFRGVHGSEGPASEEEQRPQHAPRNPEHPSPPRAALGPEAVHDLPPAPPRLWTSFFLLQHRAPMVRWCPINADVCAGALGLYAYRLSVPISSASRCCSSAHVRPRTRNRLSRLIFLVNESVGPG